MFAKHVREFIRAKPDVIFYIDSPDISQMERHQEEAAPAQSNIPGECGPSVSPLSPISFSRTAIETSQTSTSLLSSS